MSAYKTAYIRLGEAEYKKLREAEEQLRINNMLNAKANNELIQTQRSIYDNMMGIKRQNDQHFQSLFLDLEGEINRIENQASIWVEKQANQLQSDFKKYREDIENQNNAQIENITNLANQQMAQKESQYQAYWQDQEERIASLENRWQAYQSLALDWIEKDQDILDFIYNTYSIDAFTANQLEMQRQYLNQVILQYNDGFYDIAASAGFQIFISLSNSRFQLELDKSIQVLQFQKLLSKVNDLQIDLNNCRNVHAMDNEGVELSEVIDVDYWVEGRLQECASNIENLINEIQSSKILDSDQIANYSQQIQIFSDLLIDLVTQARLVVIASQLRFNVAQIIVQSLESQGFFLEQANYEKDDYRESFTAKTCNVAGNEVMIIIDPDPGLDEGGKIHIQSMDANQITEHELLQRNFEIFNAIKENGIEVENIQRGNPALINNLTNGNYEQHGKKSQLNIAEGRNRHGRY